MSANDPQPGDKFRRNADGFPVEVVHPPNGADPVATVIWVRPMTPEPHVIPFFLRDFEFVSAPEEASD